jgi:FtsH-binding integral membrane protein
MADLNQNYTQPRTVGRAEVGVVDQGLRAYMLRVYNYMGVGVAITGIVAYVTYAMSVVESEAGLQLSSFGTFIFASPFKWVVIFAPLALVFFLSARINRTQSLRTCTGVVPMSGMMPTPWIEMSPGVRYCALVSFSAEPSTLSYRTGTEPFPNVRLPTITARSRFVSAPASISEAEALPEETSTAIG